MNGQGPGFMARAREWMTPERAIAFQGIGLGLSQLGAGQPVNLSPAYEALAQRKQEQQLRGVMEQPGVMDRYTPQQRAALAAMPPTLATQILMEDLFAPPAPPPEAQIMEVDGALVRIDPVTGEAAPIYQSPQAGPTPTDDMREYQFAQSQGYQGTFTDWQIENRRAGATTVNNRVDPAPPQGFRNVYDDAGNLVEQVLIPGSQADRELQAAGVQADAQVRQFDEAISLAESIRDDPALPQILGIFQGNLPAGVPGITGGQAGADLNARVEQLQGRVFLQAFEALKGGGQITQIEGEKAERAMARLQRAQSPEAFRTALNDFIGAIEAGQAKLRQAQVARAGGSATPTAAPDFSAMDADSILNVDVMTLDAAGMAAYQARLQELGY